MRKVIVSVPSALYANVADVFEIAGLLLEPPVDEESLTSRFGATKVATAKTATGFFEEWSADTAFFAGVVSKEVQPDHPRFVSAIIDGGDQGLEPGLVFRLLEALFEHAGYAKDGYAVTLIQP